MSEKQRSQGGQESVAAAFGAAGSSGGWDSLMAGLPASGPPLRDRRRRAWFGGMLAGIAVAIGLALVMHVIQQASPNGSYFSITGSVLLVLLLGLIIGALPRHGTRRCGAGRHRSICCSPSRNVRRLAARAPGRSRCSVGGRSQPAPLAY